MEWISTKSDLKPPEETLLVILYRLNFNLEADVDYYNFDGIDGWYFNGDKVRYWTLPPQDKDND